MRQVSIAARANALVSPVEAAVASAQPAWLRILADESGQVLPWAVLLLMFVFLGLAALSLDVGHGIFIQRQLQASADAAALAGAHGLPNNYVAPAQSYSDAGFNKYGPGVTFATPVVKGLCLTSITQAPFNTPCSLPSQPNAVQVTESATFTPVFAGIFGSRTMTISATSTAAGQPGHWNIAIVLDTTPSMDTPDPFCSNKTQLQCAENGVSILLGGLDPRTDSVALFTFPAIEASASSVGADTTCSGGSPKVAPYVFPSTTATSYTGTSTPYVTGSGKNATTTYVTYQLTPFGNTYQTANDAAQIATGHGKNSRGGNCGGIQTSMNYTYLPGAIYAAQGALLGQQASLASQNISSQNAMIILSDGNATARESSPGSAFSLANNFVSSSAQAGGGNNLYATASPPANQKGYPSWIGQCGQEVDAAQTINSLSSNSTRVYTVAYGSSTGSDTAGLGNCASDVGKGNHSGISPCKAMQQMSSGYKDPQHDPYFYSDYNTPGGDAGCTAMPGNNAVTDLASIFDAIRGSLQFARLIPNNTN